MMFTLLTEYGHEAMLPLLSKATSASVNDNIKALLGSLMERYHLFNHEVLFRNPNAPCV